MTLQLMNLHTVMGNVWLEESCSQMGESLTSDKWTDHRSSERGLREGRRISHLISHTLIYRHFHERGRERERERARGMEIKLLHALIISYILY